MKILLEAPILTQSGYGEHSRLVFRALSTKNNVELYINPLNWGQTSWLSTFDTEREKIEKSINNFFHAHENLKSGINTEFDIHIHVGIPNEFERKAPRAICITAGIETDRVSADWIIKTNEEIDKLIVPSHHARDTFISTAYEAIDEKNEVRTVLQCACPVDVVPYPVKKIVPRHLDFKLETEFNFLSIALLGHRKNIENMTKWFIEEFQDESVGLVLKTGASSGSIMDREYTESVLQNVLNNHNNGDRKCKVYLLHGDLAESEIHSLYHREDIHAYVTTTHGEGYGLPIFEAAYSGLPIVATNWSGHLDFLRAEVRKKKRIQKKELFAKVDYELKEIPKKAVWENILVEGSCWAYPSESSFKEQIRKVKNNYSFYKKQAVDLEKEINKSFSKEIVLSKMIQSILEDSEIPNLEKTEKKEEILVL
jgi:glycosyltransferase involved in cell wall biosynthesis